MTEQEYKQKKCECWEKFKRTNLDGEVQWQPVNRYDVFCAAFDRAYALGKQEKDAEDDRTLKVNRQLFCRLCADADDYINEHLEEGDSDYTYYQGRSDALHELYRGECKDAEVEDKLLCVSRKQIGALQGEIFKAIMDAHDADDWQDAAHYILDVMPRSFAALFGSKCLLDEDAHEDNFATKKPQPAEPKDEGTHQEQCVPKNAESGTHSFSHILKDSFRKERRLNIAAQIVASMIGSDDWTTWRGGSNKEIWHNMAKSSLEIADALIAECEKGGIK